MLKNYFKIAWRNMVRHKAYSAINVAGLAIGVAACLLIFVVIQFELSYDTFQPNYNKIYRVVMQQKIGGGTEYSSGSPYPMSAALEADFPGSKFATVQTSYGSQVTIPASNTGVSADDKKFTESIGVLFIQPQFFDVFKYKWLSGNAGVLAAPNTVVINRSTAQKYFGDWKNAQGKIVRIDNRITAKVAGVIENVPLNTDLDLRVLISYVTLKTHMAEYDLDDGWGNNSSNHQIFMMPPSNQLVSSINARLKIFSQKHYGHKEAKTKFHFLQSLANLHYDTRFGNTLGDHITTKATIRTLSFIAILIILMASINFINLSTAQSVGRSKEVGIRKVLGSSRTQLIKQSIGETALIVIFALIVAVGIAKLALPYLKNIASVPDDISLITTGSIEFLLLTGVVVVLISGIYPALVVSGFKPVLALKNKITSASIGSVPLRRVLVVAQFSIAQLLIIGTIVAVRQMNFVNAADLGFNKEAVIIIPGNTDSATLQKSESFKQLLLQNPSVKAISFISDQPSSQNNWSGNFYYDHSGTDQDFHLYMKFGDADYFKTFGLRFKAGQPYSQTDTTKGIVINETLAKKLGVQNLNAIIGKTIKIGGGSWHPIVGVVEDFKTNTMRDEIKPTIIIQNKKEQGTIAVKLNTRTLSRTALAVQKEWEKAYPQYAYNGYFLDQNIAEFYKQENQMALVYKIFAIIAIFISCLGLYGLVSFMVVQRTKEVGVRKVLGASISSIVYMFSREFMLLIGVSFVIAAPVAYYMMNSWLQNFVFRIPLSIGVFIMAVTASLVVAWLTVGYKAVKAALANPVKSLRSE
jgi:putative ABC transport system permease protein